MTAHAYTVTYIAFFVTAIFVLQLGKVLGLW